MAPDIIVFRNFCYFAILSLSFVYLYICTFFLAALAIDQKRIDAGRWSTSQCWLKMMMVATAQMKMMLANCSGTPVAAASNLIGQTNPLVDAPFLPGEHSQSIALHCGEMIIMMCRPQWATLSSCFAHLARLFANWPARFSLKNLMFIN